MQSTTVMPKANSSSGCGLLGSLPSELRVEIYRYLVGKHTKEELNMKSREYNWNRDTILAGPDNVYNFHPAILGTNHQIRQEALDIFTREHVPIRLSTEELRTNQFEFSACTVLATGDRARCFPKVAMTLDFDNAGKASGSPLNPDDERTHIVFPADDFPAVGALLLPEIASLWYPALRVDIDENVSGEPTGHCPILRRLLGNLQTLSGLNYVEITGPVTLAQKDETTAAMYADKLPAQEVMRQVSTHFHVAGEASKREDFASAIKGYKAALYILRGSYFDEHERVDIVSGGLFDGISVWSARDDAYIRLHALIAEAYLALGQHRMARIYVERIYGRLHTYDDRHNKQKFPLQIRTGNPSAYAHLLTVAARISYTNRHYDVAVSELEEAHRLDPGDYAIQQMLGSYRRLFDEKQTRRLQISEREQEIRKNKMDATMRIVLTRKSSADTHFSHHSFRAALTQYTAALAKLSTIPSTNLSGYDLPLQILTRLALTSLKLRDYTNVHCWANATIASIPDFWVVFNNPFRDARGVAEFHTAYWAKGTACEAEGKIDGAVRNLELAVKCDGSCEEAWARLVVLREVQGLRVERVREKERRVEWRRGKRLRKKEAGRAKRRGRGGGYFLGVGGAL